jgi:hypothetical protein
LAPAGVSRRENVKFASGAGDILYDLTLLPTDIAGVKGDGQVTQNADNTFAAVVQNISVRADLARDEVYQLGRRTAYCRTLRFPLEVTTEIEVLSTSGDMVSATEEGILNTITGFSHCGTATNLRDQRINISTCEGTRISTGNKNKLASVNYRGGDAGGGNVTTTYTYTTYNKLTVLHSGDPHLSGGGWWDTRATLLV